MTPLVVARPMTFLNPIVLLGLAAAALPLIIHLFNFRKPRRIDFSSLAFLKEVEKSTMQRVRIKQWLLLALRMLAIAALVLSFARPTLEGPLADTFAAAAPVSIAVVVDNSPSMDQRDAGGAYLDQAKALAAAIVSDTEARDEVAIVPVAGTGPVDFGPGGPDALRRIGEIQRSSQSRSQVSAVAGASLVLAEQANVNRELYLIGDLQSSTLMDSLSTRISGETPLFLVPVGSGARPNISVSEVRVRSRIVEANQPVVVSALLVNHGAEDADAYTSSLFLDGTRVAQATVDLPAGQGTEVEFTASPQARGWLRGTVETEDDDYPDDNRAFFSLRVPEARRLLIVRGDGQDVRYLNAALSADQERVSLDIRNITESDLPAADLSGYDVVALVGPARIPSGVVSRIESYVRTGGGLLWFPSDRASVQDYNDLLSALGAGTVTGTTPADGSTVDQVDRIDLEHPLFEGVLDGSSPNVERPEVYRRMGYRAGGAGTESPIMELSSGQPFLQEIRHGSGTVLLMAVSPAPSWSDLPTRGLFIPLLYRSVFLLSSSESVAGELLYPGSSAELLVSGVGQAARLVIQTPGGEEVVPESRPGVGGLLVSLDGMLTEPGFYSLMADDRLVRIVSVNPDPAESDLDLETPVEAARILTGRSDAEVNVLDLSQGLTAAERVTQARRGADLWNVFMALALFFLAAEMWVARQWKPEAAA